MKPKIVKAKNIPENYTYESCYIAENFRDKAVSIARARVKQGITTQAHHLLGVDETYIITRGKGAVTVGELKPTEVGVDDVVYIPAGVSQKITNTGSGDLVFYCICTPKFTPECYVDEESNNQKDRT
jgi:mannose-6-phosphate isomerase-like protein (cupin superfamily)